MADLNLRNIPDELMVSLKTQAAAANISLKAYCLIMLANEYTAPRSTSRKFKIANPHHPACKCFICREKP